MGSVRNPAPPKGRESGPDHEPLLTGGAHSRSGPLEPKIQEPVTGRRKSLSYQRISYAIRWGSALRINACQRELSRQKLLLHSPGTLVISADLVYFPSKTPLSLGAHELRLSATTKLIISALVLSLHLRPRDRLNGGIHPRHHQMAPTSLSTKSPSLRLLHGP